MRRSTVLSLPPQLVFHESSDLLVLASSDQLVLKLKILFPSFTKQATLIRRSSVPSLPPQLIFHKRHEILTEVSTVDLLIKVACFAMRKIIFSILKRVT